MHLDAADLRDFYASPFGHVVRRLISHRIRARWRRVDGEVVVGLGYATPYLGMFRSDARRVAAFMPVAQGAIVWPAHGPCQAAMVEEDRLPLADNSVGRLLVIHCLEAAERDRALFRELWRVLRPEGRLLLAVTNRRGLWARFDSTPFGVGRPYSRGQIVRRLEEAMFTPLDCAYALHMPPLDRRVVMRSALAFERMGQRVSPGVGGLILIEARKELVSPLIRGKAVQVLGGLVTVRG